MKECLPVLLLFSIKLLFCQEISGTVTDNSTKESIKQGFIVVYNEDVSDRTLGYSRIENGAFAIKLDLNLDVVSKLILVAKVPGYSKQEKIIEFLTSDQTVKIDFSLSLQPENLNPIEITAERPKRVIKKKDTTSFYLNSFSEEGDKKLKDVIGKIPLMDYDPVSGRVKYKGKDIENITINGTDITGSGYGLIMKNLNIDIVERLEAIDNYSDNAVTKDFDSSDRKSINLVLKKNRYQLSVNVESLLGGFDLDKLATGNAVNTTVFNNKINSLNVVSQNNIGINPSTVNIEELNATFQDPVFGRNIDNLFDSEIVNTAAVPYERSRINKQGYISLNGTVKINSKTELRLNTDYLDDRHEIERLNQNTFIVEGESVTNELESVSTYDPSYLGFNLFLSRKNGVLSDFKGTLSVTKNNFSRSSRIIRNDEDSVLVNEEQVYSNIEFSTEYSKRVFKKSALQFNVVLKQESSELDFKSDPGLLNESIDSGNDHQIYDVNRKRFAPSLFFYNKVGKGNFVINLSSIYTSLDFKSRLLSTATDVVSENDNDLVNSNFFLSPSYSYKADRFTLNINPIIALLNQRLNLSEFSGVKFLPRISLNYKFQKGLVIVSGSKTAEQLSFRNSFQNIILTSENNVENNIPDLRPINSYNVNVNAFLTSSDLTTQSFQAYNNVSWSDANYINNFQVDENFLTSTNEYFAERVFSTSTGLKYSQYFKQASLRVEINPSVSYNESPISINSENITDFKSTIYSAKVGLRTLWKGLINIDTSNEFSQVRSSFNNTKLLNNSLNASLKMKVKFTKNLRLDIKYNSLVPNLSEPNYTDFFDIDLSFKFFKNVRSEFVVRNLTNRKFIVNESLDGISRRFSSNSLLPRYAGFKIQFDF